MSLTSTAASIFPPIAATLTSVVAVPTGTSLASANMATEDGNVPTITARDTTRDTTQAYIRNIGKVNRPVDEGGVNDESGLHVVHHDAEGDSSVSSDGNTLTERGDRSDQRRLDALIERLEGGGECKASEIESAFSQNDCELKPRSNQITGWCLTDVGRQTLLTGYLKPCLNGKESSKKNSAASQGSLETLAIALPLAAAFVIQ